MSARRVRERISARRRGGWQPRAIIALAVVWVLLWGTFSAANILGGLAVALVITLLLPLPRRLLLFLASRVDS